ncbi:MAG: tRNA (uridine(34)/cytosine(34)/5-carboxymethylaminomethyluridine(34)-2'-O)-methyltransferase TrmL [Thiohalobacterales bacterium]|nr:tRNA (uridine(34)/cytosine(34)/5-carboxymethylaminomethyluridine(34)-2'-O)-methyltransferase TrmL [Thiohalobacterales bacterium]
MLYEPEIPPNTGNIIRLCANTGSTLHLIHPLGFELDDTRLKRAGLDYHEYADVKQYASYKEWRESTASSRVFAITTRGSVNYSDVRYKPGDIFLFGPESRGLPQEIIDSLPKEQRVRIPMQPQSRSLNIANAVTLLLYEAWRQHGFESGR